MSTEALPPILAEISIDAPLAHVWEVMTSEATVPGWLGCMNYRREIGVTFHMQPDPAKRQSGDVSGATHCDVVTLAAPHSFAFSWYVPGTPKTMVTISLAADGADRTIVQLRHEGWEQFPIEMVRAFHQQLAGGWRSGVLPGPKQAAEA